MSESIISIFFTLIDGGFRAWYNPVITMARIRETILETLNAHGALPIADIADAAGLSKMATRYHLRLLECEGLVARDAVEHRGTVGRPVLTYALAEGGRERLPKQYDALAGQLLDEIADNIGASKTRLLLQRIGRRIAADAATRRATGQGRAYRVRRAARFLAKRGYVAQVTADRGVLALSISSCPFSRVARTHPEVCEIDLALLKALLDVSSADVQHVRNAEGACRFEIAHGEV